MFEREKNRRRTEQERLTHKTIKSRNLPAHVAHLQLQNHRKCQSHTKEVMLLIVSQQIQGLHTFLSKERGSVGNRTNGSKSLTACSLSLKSCSGLEYIISSSMTSHPYKSSAIIPHIKMALRTFSSDVTVKFGCCKNHKIP